MNIFKEERIAALNHFKDTEEKITIIYEQHVGVEREFTGEVHHLEEDGVDLYVEEVIDVVFIKYAWITGIRAGS